MAELLSLARIKEYKVIIDNGMREEREKLMDLRELEKEGLVKSLISPYQDNLDIVNELLRQVEAMEDELNAQLRLDNVSDKLVVDSVTDSRKVKVRPRSYRSELYEEIEDKYDELLQQVEDKGNKAKQELLLCGELSEVRDILASYLK